MPSIFKYSLSKADEGPRDDHFVTVWYLHLTDLHMIHDDNGFPISGAGQLTVRLGTAHG